MFFRKACLSFLVPVCLIIGCSKDSKDDTNEVAQPQVPVNPDLGNNVPTGFTLDDFKACTHDYKTSIETYWFSFADKDDGGTSLSELKLGTSEADGGPCSLHWKGLVTTAYEYGYAGIGVDLTKDTALDTYKTLSFKVRGDGLSYRVKLPMASHFEAKEFNFYGADMSCGDGTQAWKTVSIDLTKLQQEQGWGQSVKLDLAVVGKIQIQTKGQPIPAFSCEIGSLVLLK